MAAAVIRRAVPAEAAELAAVIRVAFEEYRGVLVPPSGAHGETTETVAAKLETGGGLVAAVDGGMVGCVLFHEEEGDLYFGRLSVLPADRGKGLATLLVRGVEDRARLDGLSGCRLEARLALPANRALFEHLGYEVASLGTHPGFDEPTFAVMRKRL